jgi:hypothetical protein
VNIDDAHRALQQLSDLALRDIGRAANMLWLAIGELRESVSPLGNPRIVGEWALHVQCVWRICQRGHIVVGYRDFYYGESGEPLDDWDTPGNSRFDTTVAALRQQFAAAPPFIKSIIVDEVGGFSIHLTGDYRLDVFPDHSKTECEHWRLFRPGDDQSHFVFPHEP